MFEWLGSTANGGWNALTDVLSGAGGPVALGGPFGTSMPGLGFFPTPQRTTVESDFVRARENQGLSYRPVNADAQSMIETAAYNANQWLGSPYEDQFSIPIKRAESQLLASTVSGESSSLLSRMWSGIKTAVGYHPAVLGYKAGQKISTSFFGPSSAADVKTALPTKEPEMNSFDKMLQDIYSFGQETVGKAAKVVTLADYFMGVGQRMGIISPRQTTVEVPRAGYPAGEDVQHLNWLTSAAANVFESVSSTGAAMMGQLKGLFNLGYSGPDGAQPVFTIQHELEPSGKTTTGLVIGAVALIIIFLLLRKK